MVDKEDVRCDEGCREEGRKPVEKGIATYPGGPLGRT